MCYVCARVFEFEVRLKLPIHVLERDRNVVVSEVGTVQAEYILVLRF